MNDKKNGSHPQYRGEIEPGVPPEVFKLSDTEPVVAVVARSDASEWHNIVPYYRTSRARVKPVDAS